jgi:phasin family protein
MAKANPFFDFDPTKMPEFGKLPDYSKLLSEFKFPGLDMETWMSVQKRNFEALTAANQLAVQCAQSVAQRQTELLRQAIDEARRVTAEMTGTASPAQKAARQAELAKEAFTVATANMRELAVMVTKSSNEAFDVISKRVTESFDEIKAALDQKHDK